MITQPILDEIVAVKQLRRDIDAILQRVKDLGRPAAANSTGMPASIERDIEPRVEARKHLTEAVMWLGMDLKRINDENPGSQPNPYPSSKDPATGAAIEPTADGLRL